MNITTLPRKYVPLLILCVANMILSAGCLIGESKPLGTDGTPPSSDRPGVSGGPESVVLDFWDRSRRQDFDGARGLIAAAPLRYTNWELQAPKKRNIPPRKAPVARRDADGDIGVGSPDPDFKNEKLAEQLRDHWPSSIFEENLRLLSIESTTIVEDKARVQVVMDVPNWKSRLTLEVLLRKVADDEWKICAIWN